MLKKKNLCAMVKSDGRPPDTSKDEPIKDQDQLCHLSHMIPWSFQTVTPSQPQVE
jgi:hypothetical protein